MAPLTLIGSYRIERLLGIGSFATVWLGYDASLGARVAIKVLAENWSHDLRVRERFLDEARLLWRLNDGRIVRVHALGELADGRPYLVMAWAEGGSLQDRLAGAPMPIPPALTLLREISAGVAVLHDHGIVHRDLTPGNVLFTAAGQVIIADLGLAKALAAASGLTARAGTPGYMAPEQDDPLAVVDRRADVYGLGKLGVRLLGVPGGRRPGEPIRLREGVPRKVGEVLRTATARDPADRYGDAAAFGLALDRAVRGRSRAAALAAGRTVMALASVAVLALLVSDSVSGRFTARPGVAVDPAGRISIEVPEGWRAETGSGNGWHGADAGAVAGSGPLEERPGGARRLRRAVRRATARRPSCWRTAGRSSAWRRRCGPAGRPVWSGPSPGTAPARTAGRRSSTRWRPGRAATVWCTSRSHRRRAARPAFVDTLLAGLRVR